MHVYLYYNESDNDVFVPLSLVLRKFLFPSSQEYGLWAWGNQEQQYYTDSSKNVEVRDGKLLITALRETTKLEDGYTFNYTSGRVITKGQVGVYAGMKTEDGRRWDTIRVEASLKSPEPSEFDSLWYLP